MKKIEAALFTLLLQAAALEARMFHRDGVEEEWKEENLASFNELILSWNASRPVNGKYLFYISIKTDDWSPWLLYASWGSSGQSSFFSQPSQSSIKVYQDALEVMNGKTATGFQIKVATEGDAAIDQVRGLHVYTNNDISQPAKKIPPCPFICLPVNGISQIILKHDRARDLCSPTSTTAVVRYLLKTDQIDPIAFAKKVWDSGFDIFGNWVFNVAEAAAELGPLWDCWVERLNGFYDIYQRLQEGTPVVTSIRGPLPGSAKPYITGHLVAVIGYDSDSAKVICMDPAFPADEQTRVTYDLAEFVEAWGRRGKIAYLFRSKNYTPHCQKL